jgi:hypothetical protein
MMIMCGLVHLVQNQLLRNDLLVKTQALDLHRTSTIEIDMILVKDHEVEIVAQLKPNVRVVTLKMGNTTVKTTRILEDHEVVTLLLILEAETMEVAHLVETPLTGIQAVILDEILLTKVPRAQAILVEAVQLDQAVAQVDLVEVAPEAAVVLPHLLHHPLQKRDSSYQT